MERDRRVVYVSPNRSHHYRFAQVLGQAGVLRCFLTGASRWVERNRFEDLGDRVVRHDLWQNLLVAAGRMGLSRRYRRYIAFRGKRALDHRLRGLVRETDVVIAYSGTAHDTMKFELGRRPRPAFVTECVNCHVSTQMAILEEEHQRLGLPFISDCSEDMRRRVYEYENADRLFGPSEVVKDSFIEKGISASRFVKIPYGVAVGGGAAVGERSGEAPLRVLYVGSVSPRKGVRYLVQALDRVDSSYGIELTVVGSVERPSGIEDLMPSLNARIRFTGVLTGRELSEAFMHHDVLVLPTLEEGMALVIGEAIGYGLPVITTDRAGADSLFTDGKEGFLVGTRDVNGIAEKLKLLASDEGLRGSMSARAREKAASLPTWTDAGAQLVGLATNLYS